MRSVYLFELVIDRYIWYLVIDCMEREEHVRLDRTDRTITNLAGVCSVK